MGLASDLKKALSSYSTNQNLFFKPLSRRWLEKHLATTNMKSVPTVLSCVLPQLHKLRVSEREQARGDPRRP